MSVLQTQMSPMNQQLVGYYLRQENYTAAATQYLAGLHELVARNGQGANLTKIHDMVLKTPEKWSALDRATLYIFQASAEDKAPWSEAKELLASDPCDLSKALQSYCDSKINSA